MLFLIFAGIVCLVFGIALMVNPESVRKLERKYNKFIVIFEGMVYNHTKCTGLSLLMISAVCFFIVFYLVKRY
jgi:hypothetical protein